MTTKFKTGGICVCQICTCGRHRCPHNRGSIGQAPVKADCNFTEYKTAFERWSFQPPRKSLRPPLKAHTSSVPMDETTVYQDTYTTHDLATKRVRAKQEYVPTDKKMEVLSTYARDYVGKPSTRTDSYKPDYSYVPATAKFHNDTMYRVSFKNHGVDDSNWCRATPIKHKECIKIESGCPQSKVSSTMKEDFTKHANAERAKLVKPTQETQQPSGKFDGKTTYKTEFTKKPNSCKTKSCNPCQDYRPNNASFHGESTAKSAYKPHTNVRREPSYKPHMEYQATSTPFEGQTTSSDAYKKWPVSKPETPSWAKKKAFESAVGMTEKNSSYQDDFKKPSRHERAQLAQPGGQVPLNVFREGGKGAYNTRTQYQEQFVTYNDTIPAKSFKVIQVYENPKEKVGGESTYRSDYKGDPTEQAKLCRPQQDMPREASSKHLMQTTYCETFKGSQPGVCPAGVLSEASKKNGVSVGSEAGNYKLTAIHEGHHLFRTKSKGKAAAAMPRWESSTKIPAARPSSATKPPAPPAPRPSSRPGSARKPCGPSSRPSSANKSATRARPTSGRKHEAKAKMAVVC